LAFSRKLAATRELAGLLEATVGQVAAVFESEVAVFMVGTDGKLAVRATRATQYVVDEKELGVARWVFDHDQSAGVGTSTLPAARALYLPLVGSQGTVGVLGVCPPRPGAFHDPDQLRLLEAFANQAAVAIERARLAEDARSAWERVEAEFMRNTLLSSVSHDLRTPLAAITGAASTMLETEATLPAAARHELVETVYEESERMERLINNLLDMTRLESGGLLMRKEWQPIQDVIGSSLHHLERRLKGRQVRVEAAADLPLVSFDEIAIEQVLTNLLDNALEYTPPGSRISVRAMRTSEGVALEVADRGPGLPAGTEQRVFEKFFRAHPSGSDAPRRGIGLGLAICRGIIGAHGGTISANNREGGGAEFRFTIPIQGTPPDSGDLN
ncbi:MAG TPA: ATP-binding protein, partial [Tepidisphaeraceae bacterium]|nr:ATP-binding protein [Tepidisphaeraceae bacterium]